MCFLNICILSIINTNRHSKNDFISVFNRTKNSLPDELFEHDLYRYIHHWPFDCMYILFLLLWIWVTTEICACSGYLRNVCVSVLYFKEMWGLAFIIFLIDILQKRLQSTYRPLYWHTWNPFSVWTHIHPKTLSWTKDREKGGKVKIQKYIRQTYASDMILQWYEWLIKITISPPQSVVSVASGTTWHL